MKKTIYDFRKILDEHGLSSEENAERIAEFVTNHPKGTFEVKDFAEEFGIPNHDAKIILEVIYKATEFKKNIVEDMGK